MIKTFSLSVLFFLALGVMFAAYASVPAGSPTWSLAVMSGQNARLNWVDTAKGMSIILVVMMYCVFNVGQDLEGVGLFHYVIGFATPFRMPEFFLLSGLFLDQVLS
eukprot:gene13329-17978_t